MVTFSIAAVYMGYQGKQAAISALIGGMVCIIPNLYLAAKLFQHRGAHAARRIVRNFYWGEAVKIFLTMLMFALVFIYIPINPQALFITFIVVQLCMWLAPWLVNHR